MSGKILIVEDEPGIVEMLAFTLDSAGYDHMAAGDTREAAKLITDAQPDLVLLDHMLPGQSGRKFAEQLRNNEKTRDLPIIMLTALGDEADIVGSFAVGVDDYITKPFSSRELLARIKAVIRRSSPKETDETDETLSINGLEIDLASHRVRANGEELNLGPTEFRLLKFFMEHVERVYSRSQLIDLVWGENIYIEDRTVDVHIRRLREMLAGSDHASLIQTVRGVGYRFSARD